MMRRLLSVSILLLLMLVVPNLPSVRDADAANPTPHPGANGRPFHALQSQIDDLQSQVDTIDANIAGISAQITALESNIANLQGQIAQNSGDVASLQSQVTSNTNSINALQALAASLQGQIILLQLTKQNLVTGSCVGGSAIRTILPGGGVVCEFDAGESRTAVFSAEFSIAPGNVTWFRCLSGGWLVTGGGHSTSTGTLIVIQSEPSAPNIWFVRVYNPGSTTGQARATAVCASSQ
jgi:hypothetical protein